MTKKKTAETVQPSYLVEDTSLIEKLNTKSNNGGKKSEIPELFKISQENVGKWIKAVHHDGTFYNAGAITRIRKKLNLTEKIKIRAIEEDGTKKTYIKAVE